MDHDHPANWDDITHLLNHIRSKKNVDSAQDGQDHLQFFGKGTAFITFSYGIDGVTIEISKYAHTLENIYRSLDDHSIHLIGESFDEETSSIFSPDWRRFKLDGINGWDKWEQGIWFEALFKKRLISQRKDSHRLAGELYR